jgi:hypothetical protein
MAITQGAEDINSMVENIEEYEKWVLKINYGKTEYLSTNPSNELEIDRNKVKTSKNLEYLGSIVQDNGLSDGEIKKKELARKE